MFFHNVWQMLVNDARVASGIGEKCKRGVRCDFKMLEGILANHAAINVFLYLSTINESRT
jgi:hypothetical protein